MLVQQNKKKKTAFVQVWQGIDTDIEFKEGVSCFLMFQTCKVSILGTDFLTATYEDVTQILQYVCKMRRMVQKQHEISTRSC